MVTLMGFYTIEINLVVVVLSKNSSIKSLVKIGSLIKNVAFVFFVLVVFCSKLKKKAKAEVVPRSS